MKARGLFNLLQVFLSVGVKPQIIRDEFVKGRQKTFLLLISQQ